MLRILVKHARWRRNKRSRQARETESGPRVGLCSTFSAISIWSWLSFQLKCSCVSKKSEVYTGIQKWQTDSRASRSSRNWSFENLKILRQFQFLRYCWKLTTWVCRTWPVVSSLDRNKLMHRSISQPLMIKIRISTCHHILYFIWSILGKYVLGIKFMYSIWIQIFNKSYPKIYRENWVFWIIYLG